MRQGIKRQPRSYAAEETQHKVHQANLVEDGSDCLLAVGAHDTGAISKISPCSTATVVAARDGTKTVTVPPPGPQ